MDSRDSRSGSRNPPPDRTVEVCREFIRQRCDRTESQCRYAHPAQHCPVINGRVTCCMDSVKGRCTRDKCRYYHPPPHIGETVMRAASSQRAPEPSRGRSPPPLVPTIDNRDLNLAGLSVVSPDLADILRGYKNALDAALMATRLLSSGQSGSSRGAPMVEERSSRRMDTIEVCRQFLRGTCTRKEEDCRFAHPPNKVSVGSDNTVTVCIDFLKNRCTHDPCRYFHPPEHLKNRVLVSSGGASSGGGARKRSYGGGSPHTEDRDRRFDGDRERRYDDGDRDRTFNDEPPYKRSVFDDLDRTNY